MASIISLPAELLLMICGDDGLEPIDLKSLRLSHRIFVELAAERLFHRLSIIFKDETLSTTTRRYTTVAQRINELICMRAPYRFRSCSWRELHLEFHIDQRNGFNAFSGSTCANLFPMLGNIRKIIIYQDSARSLGLNYHIMPSLSNGVRDILVALKHQVRTTKIYDNVRELSFTGLEKFITHCKEFTNLTVLRLHLVAEGESYARPFRPKYDLEPIMPETKYDAVSKLLIASPLLEILKLGYFHPHFRGRSELLEASCFMDSLLERIPGFIELKIHVLELDWIALPRKVENLAKLKCVQEIHFATYDENSVPKLEESYCIFHDAGFRPTSFRGGVFLDRQSLEYMVSSEANFSDLEIMPLAKEPNQDFGVIYESFINKALPCLSKTLRFLDLHMELDGLPSISHLQISFIGRLNSPENTLNDIMMMLKSCHELVELNLHLHPEYSLYRAPWWFWESPNNKDLFTKQRDEMSRRLPMIEKVFLEWKEVDVEGSWRNLKKVGVLFEGYEDNLDGRGDRLELSFRLVCRGGICRFIRRSL